MTLKGKNINMRTVDVNDAEFIYNMRSDTKRTKYLSPITGTIETQKTWIKAYKEKELNKEEFYFIIESKQKESYGLIRLYDIKGDSFSWGSWLIKESAPTSTAIESALLLYQFAFDTLKFTKSHFDVRKENHRVLSFHKRFGATISTEDEHNFYFSFTKESYSKIKQKYKRYL